MGIPFLSYIQTLLPFLLPSPPTDLSQSTHLVSHLPLPDPTKQFIFAFPVPESNSTVYILATQNLSEQSAIDAHHLITHLKPDLVIAQIAPSTLSEIQSEEENHSVPTSVLGVLRNSFVDRVGKDKYESVAGSLVLKEIFGVGFFGHFLAAKKAAKEVGSTVLLLESPFVNSRVNEECDDGKIKLQGLSGLHSTNLVSQNVVSNSKRLYLTNDLHPQTLKSLVSALQNLNSKSGSASEVAAASDFEAPSYAQTVYPLLTDLHDIFTNLPLIGRALVNVQKILCNVENGDVVDSKLLSEVQAFRIAVESLRAGLNIAGRRPISRTQTKTKIKTDINSKGGYSDLSIEDKSHALFAQAIRSQTKEFKNVVAIVDASSLYGLRKHWNTVLPPEVEDLIEQFFTEYEGEGEGDSNENKGKKKRIASKPVVAVGAGATAVIGVSSLSKAVPASTLMKMVTYKLPVSLKLGLVQAQKAVAIALSKILGPSKVIAPGFASSGAKSASVLKASASAEKIRTVAHSVIASAERTSFSAVRTAFYEIMRKRRVQPIRSMPWATFGCSFATCAGLFVYGDGIECAAESIPVAPTIASLGRGLRSLHQASQAVREADGTQIKETIQSIMYSLKNEKVSTKRD